MSFLERVRRKHALRQAVKAARGFRFYASQYENATTLPDALDLFFTNVLRSLRELLSTHEVAADVSTESFLRNLEAFHTSVEDLLMEHTEAWVVLAKEHMTPKSMQKKKELQAKQKQFADTLEVELRKLRDRAAGYLVSASRLGLANNSRFLKMKPSLERWRSLTFTDFCKILQSGDVPWDE